jgi:hypothetical protein
MFVITCGCLWDMENKYRIYRIFGVKTLDRPALLNTRNGSETLHEAESFLNAWNLLS